MKRLLCLFLLCGILVSFDGKAPKVLLYIEDGSVDLQYMLIHEVGKMRDILKQSGFDVAVATLSGEILKTDSITVTSDLKLREVNIDDYEGFILPCMANADNDVTSVEKDFVKKIVNAGKPIAAQTGAIWILAKAGVLNGKKFAFRFDATGHPDFENAIYGGRGVVQDGIIITSGTCPMIAKNTGNPDGTAKLTQTLIDAIKVKLNKHHSNK